MSRILCIIDGMTDPQFRAEAYPSLSVMHRGEDMDTCRGDAPESLGCILHLLGVPYVPRHLRGYAEALGAGISIGRDDLVLRGSWFARDAGGNCTVPVPAPERLETRLNCRYFPMEQYKSLVVIPGGAAEIGSFITHAPYDCTGQPAETFCPEGSELLRTLFSDSLRGDRCLILWGESVYAQLQPYPRRAAVICGTAVVKGIAKLLQMDLMQIPGATGDTDTDLAAKTETALLAARHYGTVVLHINGADEASHRRNLAEKQSFLQKVDQVVLRMLLQSGHEVQVLADHGTDPYTGRHLPGLQPVFYSRMQQPAEGGKREWAVQQLRRKAAELGFPPRKADFDELTRCRIKYALGPWPRALEAAKLKEPKKEKRRSNR